ncbi:hypothetical protein ACFWPQ_22445 [Streptomyces sp. NPDC058464]|uniref:hypothetical protein n=1 Tax=Streptomyces sp. NPDC058464 TaxID=3346511 RepID=UPI0036594491
MDMLAFDGPMGVAPTVAAGSPQERFAAGLFLLSFAAISGYGLLRLMVRRRDEARIRDWLVQLWDTLQHSSQPAEAHLLQGVRGAVVIAGRTTAGTAGTLTAPLSGSACVWYRVRVTRDDEEGSNGGTRHVVLYEDRCDPDLVAVAVADATSVVLDPGLCTRSLVPGRKNDLVERIVEECTRPPSDRQFLTPGPHLASLRDTGRVDRTALKHMSNTTGFTVTEDVVRPDIDVLVAGCVATVGKTLTLTAREGHRDGVTAMTSAQITGHIAARRRWQKRLAFALTAATLLLSTSGMLQLSR